MTTNTTKVTAKVAISHVQGFRTALKGLSRLVGEDNAKIQRKMAVLDYVEATLVAQRASKKSGLKAGMALGFKPFVS